eukprot:645975-Amorphochlora_amoeboformis.AAC.1
MWIRDMRVCTLLFLRSRLEGVDHLSNLKDILAKGLHLSLKTFKSYELLRTVKLVLEFGSGWCTHSIAQIVFQLIGNVGAYRRWSLGFRLNFLNIALERPQEVIKGVSSSARLSKQAGLAY